MRYGLLSYSGTGNIGDEIQSLAAQRLLPQVDLLVDREHLNAERLSDERIKMILNGWFCHHPLRWPPAACIQPLLISFHLNDTASFDFGLTPGEVLLREPIIKYLNGHGPVGARDMHTLKLLQEAGVESYFSGCLTLTFNRPDISRSDDVVALCDVPSDVFEHVKRTASRKRIVAVEHGGFNDLAPITRLKKAERLLYLYASAGVVITSRLHCALPCVAMGTPVLLLDVAEDLERFSGLDVFVRHCSKADFLSKRFDFDLDDPGPNLNNHLAIRQALIDRTARFVDSVSLDNLTFEMSAQDLALHEACTIEFFRNELALLRKQIKSLA